MHVSQHRSSVNDTAGVKLPPINGPVYSEQHAVNPIGDSTNSRVTRNSRTIHSQCLIYRSVPPTPRTFTLTDMIGADITPPNPVKVTKTGLSGSTSSEFAKRFMSRPTRQPKVVEFNIGRHTADKRRRGINGFFPSMKLRTSAKAQPSGSQKENREQPEEICYMYPIRYGDSMCSSLTCLPRAISDLSLRQKPHGSIYGSVTSLAQDFVIAEKPSQPETPPKPARMDKPIEALPNSKQEESGPTHITLLTSANGTWRRVNERPTNAPSHDNMTTKSLTDNKMENDVSVDKSNPKDHLSVSLSKVTVIKNTTDGNEPHTDDDSVFQGDSSPQVYPIRAFSRGLVTRESYTNLRIRHTSGSTQISSNLQLVPTMFTEVQPKSASRSISRASKQSAPRKTPESIRTAPAGPEAIIVYPETFECDDLSYLPPPKRILPKRDVPWVFRYKVKRNMNELSKIMASKPQQVADA